MVLAVFERLADIGVYIRLLGRAYRAWGFVGLLGLRV